MSNILDSVLKQAEQVQKDSTPKPKVDTKEILKKYFIPRVEDGKTEGEYTFRILPTSDGSSPFIKAYFYNIKINGKYKKIYAVYANEKGEDPIQDLHDVLRVGDETDKKLARNYQAKEFWILKGIERGKEEEGAKFWRFAHNYKGQGIFDKIVPLFKKYGDISNPDTGIDFTITCGKDKDGNSVISTILPEPASKLHSNAEMMKALLADDLDWKDIFRKEKEVTVEYLSSVAENKVPYWDDEKKTMVTPGSKSETTTNTVTTESQSKVDMTYTEASEAADLLGSDDDDLPF